MSLLYLKIILRDPPCSHAVYYAVEEARCVRFSAQNLTDMLTRNTFLYYIETKAGIPKPGKY